MRTADYHLKCIRHSEVPACVVAAVGLLAALTVFGQSAKDAAVRPTPKIYEEHLHRVQQVLPPHSALPPLLDLSNPDENVPSAGKKWEDRFTGSMGERPIDDPGVHSLDESTSILTTTTEYSAPLLPAKLCPIIAIAKPLKASVHFAYNQRFVYTSFELELLEVLKGRNTHMNPGGHIIAAQLGGSIRFLSGHEVACIEANQGFLDVGKQYLLFLWEPVKSSNTYMIGAPYLLEQDHLVFPVFTDLGQTRYSGVPADAFIKKVKGLVEKNIDSD